MPVDSATFRTVLGQWPSGVCVVTTTGARGAHGMTASSFSSVSLDPPMVSVCLGNHLPSRMLLETAGKFAISFLGKDQAHVGRRFAGQHPEITDRFAGLDWTITPNGVPVLSDAVAWLDCRVAHAYPGGDHTIFVGAVTEAATQRVTSPLLFHSRTWGQVADPLPTAIHLTVDVAAGDPLAQALREAGARIRHDAGHAEFLVAADGTGLPSSAQVTAARRAGATVAGYVADAFDPAREPLVLATVEALAALGCDEVGLAEHPAGPASPLQVRRVLQDAIARVRPATLRVRLAGGHSLALVNALVAMKSGVSHFDTVAPGSPAAGLPLGDLLHLSRQLEVPGPIDPAEAVDGRDRLRPAQGLTSSPP
ncbi:flavin reductase [Amorphoplanes digitatis]|uniref:Flavin reductase (DIM6/NTAB) family NADH-FMN oxidoreductase RutF n=1 Tax=Actinoplanes digitatis TaxID=1868 RepID=A0A7W7HVW3_9ACTN|nr:flavin reductase [Actinoplanes digitatis]MBB4761710.1 flavin reductase (DIM6/NTAB) family NADH-FMN oxidoreductase RutF [Actinoplanes digitatis]